MTGDAPRIGDPPAAADRIDAWIAALEARHLASLRFSELTRALRALSSAYVERRDRLARGAALDGAGKRAAFALYYGLVHFTFVRHIVAAVGADEARIETILDLGCGTGVAGAAWALSTPRARDARRHRQESVGGRRSARGRTARWEFAAPPAGPRSPAPPGRRDASASSPATSSTSSTTRSATRLLTRLFDAHEDGAPLLVVEPIALRAMPWWSGWASAFHRRGGRADEWRFRPQLPEIVQRLAHAAGLSGSEIKGRSLWLAAGRS